MARKPKTVPVTTPKRVVKVVEQGPTREERRAAKKLQGRFAPRLGWGNCRKRGSRCPPR